ncbi:MAG: SHOCT domain-containing protein [Anaerotignaceae bacterium]
MDSPHHCDIKMKNIIERVEFMRSKLHIEEEFVQENSHKVMVDITKEQSEKEVQYKMSVKLLKNLMRRGIITDLEYAQIDRLNQGSFSPTLSKVYV